MNTSELVDRMAKKQDLSKAETRRILDAVTETMSEALSDNQAFTLPKLGTFDVHTRDKHRSYNPYYKQYVMLPAKRVVQFQPSENLKDEVK